jgi:hypothetical protein
MKDLGMPLESDRFEATEPRLRAQDRARTPESRSEADQDRRRHEEER